MLREPHIHNGKEIAFLTLARDLYDKLRLSLKIVYTTIILENF